MVDEIKLMGGGGGIDLGHTVSLKIEIFLIIF